MCKSLRVTFGVPSLSFNSFGVIGYSACLNMSTLVDAWILMLIKDSVMYIEL
jgi:hypothetical protein